MQTVKLIISVLIVGLLGYQPSISAQGEASDSPIEGDTFDQDSQGNAGADQGFDESSNEGNEYLSSEDEEGKIDQPPPPSENYSTADQPSDTRPPVEQPAENSAFEYFRDKLAPYGEWTWTSEFGWVWHPREVASDWRPYTNGHWVYTEYGWTWSSYEPWGWAPFHYGRWAFLGDSWVWVPGTRWAPAWVMWRYSDGYIGWSPLLAGFDLWYGWSYYPVHYNHWTFVNWNRFHDPHPYHYFIPRHQTRDVFRHTYYPGNCRNGGGPLCQRGPARAYVNRHVSTPVVMTRVHNVYTGGRGGHAVSGLGLQGNRLNIYRPRFGSANAQFRRQPQSNLQRVSPPSAQPGQMRNSYQPRMNESNRGIERARQFDRPTINRQSVDRPNVVRPSINRPSVRPQGNNFERLPQPGKDIYSRPPSNSSPSIETHSSSPARTMPTILPRSPTYRGGSSSPAKSIRSTPSTPSFRSAPSAPPAQSNRGGSRDRERSNSSHSR
jgi:hypothetical protein